MQIDTGNHIYVITNGTLGSTPPMLSQRITVTAADQEESKWPSVERFFEEEGMAPIQPPQEPEPEPEPESEPELNIETPPQQEASQEDPQQDLREQVFQGVKTEYDHRPAMAPGQYKELDISKMPEAAREALHVALGAGTGSNQDKAYFRQRYEYLSSNSNFDPVTAWLLDTIVMGRPESYFDLTMYRQENAERWMMPALRSIGEQSPRNFLIKQLYRIPRLQAVTPYMWQSVWDNEFEKAAETPGGAMFKGDANAIKHLGKLATMISKTDPKYYLDNVYNRMSDLLEISVGNGTISGKMYRQNLLPQIRRAKDAAEKELHGRESGMKELMSADMLVKLVKTADILDRKGEYELAEELDNILKEFC